MAEPMSFEEGVTRECGNCGGDIAHDPVLGQWIHARDDEAQCKPDGPFADPCPDDGVTLFSDAARLVAERDAARAEVGRLRAKLDDAHGAIEEARAAIDRGNGEIAEVEAHLKRSTDSAARHLKEITDLAAERDEARAKADHYFEHLCMAHPLHFKPNVLGERLCGCGGQWPCPATVLVPRSLLTETLNVLSNRGADVRPVWDRINEVLDGEEADR